MLPVSSCGASFIMWGNSLFILKAAPSRRNFVVGGIAR